MANTFNEASQEVANKFIKSVVLADDEVLLPEFNSKELICSFAESNKMCSILNFDSEKDFNTIFQMDSIADVTILDWKIHEDNGSKTEAEVDSEEDVEEIEIRGKFTKPVINEIARRALDKSILKLVVIYTTEDGLSNIINEVEASLKEEEFYFDRIDDFSLQKDMIRITVLGKENLKDKGIAEIAERAYTYKELPDAISKEFSHITTGIITNTVLKSISILREKTFNLLNIFNSKLDPAFLSHRAMSPYPEDAGELLISTIVESFTSMLSYSDVSDYYNSQAIKLWLEAQKFSPKTINISNIVIDIKEAQLIKWQNLGYNNFFKEEFKEQKGAELTDNQIENFDKGQLVKQAPKLFLPDNVDANNIHEDFSILTHHQSNFNVFPSKSPMLTLGAVIMKFGFYYLCIQQPCDSVRIKPREERKFLFLKLEEADKKFSIIFKDEKDSFIKLRVCTDSFNIVTFNFNRTKNGSVYAKKLSSGYYFKDNRNQKYKWILDLKKSHAQKISNDFSANLSRVGLNESEWLRRS